MLPLADLHALRFGLQRDPYTSSYDPLPLRARDILRQIEAERHAAAKARRRARRQKLWALLSHPLRFVRSKA